MSDNIYKKALDEFRMRYRRKKIVNSVISLVIVVLGITSFLYGLKLEPGVTIFRWMTVDGTLFTTLSSAVFVIVYIIEISRHTEMTLVPVYYARLSSAVAESVIFIVVIFSHLPFFEESLPIFDRYDSFIMHLVIPILTVASFILNDSPIGKLRGFERLHGTWFVTIYAVVIFIMIHNNILTTDLIPYFFLDYRHESIWILIIAFVFIYGTGYLMSWRISEWNRKLSWKWFKGIGGKVKCSR